MERSGTGPLARVCGPSSCPLGRDRLATSPAIATKTFTTWYSRFEALHGRKTILTFNATNEEKPFAPFQQEESTTTSTSRFCNVKHNDDKKSVNDEAVPKLTTKSVADDVNALFHQNDTGVIMHVLDLTEDSHNPWLACLSESDDCLSWKPYGRLSFSIVNQLSWNEAAKANKHVRRPEQRRLHWQPRR